MNFFFKHYYLFFLVLLLYFPDKINAGQKTVDSLALEAKNITLSDTQRIRLLISVYNAYDGNENYVEGKPYLEEALQLALQSGDKQAFADVTLVLGEFFLTADNHPEALRLEQQALSIYESKKDDEKASIALMYIGLVYYAEKNNAEAQKSYTRFDPSGLAEKWDTPILIFHGGKDYRVPLGQGLEAFHVAQLKGIKSKLVVFPEENHWALHAQNAMVWQREFFKWLKETL